MEPETKYQNSISNAEQDRQTRPSDKEECQLIYKQDSEALSLVFKDKNIAELIVHQINQLSSAYKYQVRFKSQIHIHVRFPMKTSEYIFKQNDSDKIVFIIVLGVGFPLVRPRVYLKSPITYPNINDCRDFSTQLVQQWSIKHRLKNLIDQIPGLLKKICSIDKAIQYQRIGRFYAGQVFHLQLLKQLGGEQFISFEIGQEQIKLFVISQTQTHFLLMYPQKQPEFVNDKLIVPKQNEIDKMTLIFMAEIQSLSQIKINKENNMEFCFTFSSIKTRNMQLERINVVKKLKIANGCHLITKVLRSINRYQSVKTSIQTFPAKNSQQKQILEEISKKQQKLKHYLNQETIQDLNKAYQAAVEYYSNKNLPYHQIYLGMISSMYTRKDVKLILDAVSQKRQKSY